MKNTKIENEENNSYKEDHQNCQLEENEQDEYK